MAIPALIAAAGIGAGGNIMSSASEAIANKALQEDAQSFNAEQAEIARQFTAQENQLARDFNSAEAAKSREFQEHMASTNYQRTVSDMEAAGINPAALGGGAAVNGSGSAGASASASSASGAAASSGMNRVHFSQLFNSAMVEAFTDKEVVDAFANRLRSNAKNVVRNDFEGFETL